MDTITFEAPLNLPEWGWKQLYWLVTYKTSCRAGHWNLIILATQDSCTKSQATDFFTILHNCRNQLITWVLLQVSTAKVSHTLFPQMYIQHFIHMEAVTVVTAILYNSSLLTVHRYMMASNWLKPLIRPSLLMAIPNHVCSHWLPLMKLTLEKAAAWSAVSSWDQPTRPLSTAPGPEHWYCP